MRRLMESMPKEIEGVSCICTRRSQIVNSTAATNQIFENVAIERSNAIEQMLLGIAEEREMTLDQTLQGTTEGDGSACSRQLPRLFYWLELEMEALVVRLFLVFAGLITLWFSLRLVYRYWVDRAANNYLKTVGVMLLIVISFLDLSCCLTLTWLNSQPRISASRRNSRTGCS